jgi:preprotein translocase subunit SecA
VLVGTVSVENSEILSQMLRRRGIPHAVLNAKYHAKEAEIIAQAGRRGAVTVATNMAGRGTDILLGGNPESLAITELRGRGITPEETPEEYEPALVDAVQRWHKQCEDEAEEVIEAGGLYVLGTERHDARRIDNQLRGRSGRQGDPGESRFYLSLQDDLMKRFRASAVEAVMDRLNIPEDVPIESKLVTRQIRSAQTQIEAQNAEIRKDVLKYDEVMNKQRQVIYAERRRVLHGEDLNEQVTHMMAETVSAYVDGATATDEWDLEQLWSSLNVQLYPVGVTVEEVEEEAGGRHAIDADFLKRVLTEDIHAAYAQREEELTAPVLRELERHVLLQVIDRKWREHLYEMDYLRDGVGLRAYAQRDPLVEYNREGFDMFQQMLEGVKEEAVGFLFRVEVRVEPSEVSGVGAAPRLLGRALEARPQPQQLLYSAPAVDGAAGRGETPVLVQEGAPAALRGGATRPNGGRSVVSAGSPGAQAANKRPAVGQAVGSAPARNQPCPCGSGKKYKHCHGAPNAT